MLRFLKFSFIMMLAILPIVISVLKGTEQVIAIVIFIVLFAGREVKNIWVLGIPVAELSESSDLINQYLNFQRSKIVEEINRFNNDPISENDIRINVMLIAKKRFRFSKRIKIFYSVGSFSDDEKNMLWKKGEKTGCGTCGAAWSNKRPTIFDSKNEIFNVFSKRLSQKQQSVKKIKERNSVLSIQIKAKNKSNIIGVLNLDSKLNIDKTHFEEHEIIERAVVEVRKLIYFLPQEGVRM